jgi:hypothetical protein
MPWVDAKARHLALEVQQLPVRAFHADDGTRCGFARARQPRGATVEVADELDVELAARLVQSLA